MLVKLISPNLNMLVGCRRNDDGRRGLGKGFGNGYRCSGLGVHHVNFAFDGHGPAAQRPGNIQPKPSMRSGHFPFAITSDIVVPYRCNC
jgi:hypothetical protein